MDRNTQLSAGELRKFSLAIVRGGTHKASLPGAFEIPMESFARAVEIVLKESELRDILRYAPDADFKVVCFVPVVGDLNVKSELQFNLPHMCQLKF